MKTTLCTFLFSALSVFASGWDERVNFYCDKIVDPRSYAITESAGVYTIEQWDEASIGVKQPSHIDKLLGHDEEIDAQEWSSVGQKREAQSKAAIQAASESNLVAIAEAYGITNRPLDWLTMAQVGQQISATNLIQGMALRLTVLEQLQFYVLNGGDARKVGKKK